MGKPQIDFSKNHILGHILVLLRCEAIQLAEELAQPQRVTSCMSFCYKTIQTALVLDREWAGTEAEQLPVSCQLSAAMEAPLLGPGRGCGSLLVPSCCSGRGTHEGCFEMSVFMVPSRTW